MVVFDVISWFLMATAFLAALVWWSDSRRTYTKDNIPPFPVQPWPIFGHFFMLAGNLIDSIKVWRQKAGDIFSMEVGGALNIFVTDFDTMKEIWVKHSDLIVNMPPNFADDILGEHNSGIIRARDDNWKEQRATTLSILRSFGMGKNVMANKIQEEVSFLIEKLASLQGRPEDVHPLINVSVSNLICSVVIGKRFDYEDPYFTRFMLMLRDVMKYHRMVTILTHFKFLWYLPGDLLHVKKWARVVREINETFSKAYIRKLSQSFCDIDEPDNFITAYLKEMKKLKDRGVDTHLNEENLKSIVRLLIIAGSESTSNTILWCLLYMLHHPGVQEKVFREIDSTVGSSRVPDISDKPKLVYLNAVIMETQRMSSTVPIGTIREVSASFEVRGFTFPKASILWPIIYSVHQDKKIWGDPENFRPDRFIDSNGALICREELIPFSIGKRICLGEAMVKMQLFLFVAAMFQRFRFEPAEESGELPELTVIYASTVQPMPFKVRLIHRKIES